MASGSVVGAAVGRTKAENWPEGNALPAIVPQPRRYATVTAEPGICPEIDCVRHILPRRVTAVAERRAAMVGVGAERVLICADAITEEAYLTALAGSLGTSYERFDSVSRADCPLDDDRLIEAAAAGLLPLRQQGGLVWIIAPQGMTARQLADPRQPRPDWLRAFRLTSADRLRQFAMRHGQRALGQRAAEGLRRTRPLFSNAPTPEPGRRARTLALVLLAFTFSAVAPIAMIEALGGLLCALFLASAILRVWSACFAADEASPSPAHVDDRKLPIYTVICALYREAAVVGDLVAAIRGLDYPGIMAQTPSVCAIIPLTRMFTANYAGQFDVFLPGVAALHLPFPLGGSSNHFRTALLRKAGGWDPYNVTEDADLGIRLYRLGYRAATMTSATYEEAPARFPAWLRQRTRWYKGWLQTWRVHMRRPRRLVRELTLAGAIAFQIFFAANVLAALIHPLFMAGLAYSIYALPEPWANEVIANSAPIFITSLLSGYASTVALDLVGMRHGLAKNSRLAPWRGSRSDGRQERQQGLREGPRADALIAPSRPTSVAQIGPGAPIAPIKIMQTARGTLFEFGR